MALVALIYAGCLLIFVVVADAGGLKPLGDLVQQVPFLDKGIHFVMFGVLALLANLALLRHTRLSPLRAIGIGSMIVLIVSTVDEFSNHLFPVRYWSLGDLTANYLGVVLLGMLPLWPTQSKRRLADGAYAAADRSHDHAAAHDAAEPRAAV